MLNFVFVFSFPCAFYEVGSSHKKLPYSKIGLTMESFIGSGNLTCCVTEKPKYHWFFFQVTLLQPFPLEFAANFKDSEIRYWMKLDQIDERACHVDEWPMIWSHNHERQLGTVWICLSAVLSRHKYLGMAFNFNSLAFPCSHLKLMNNFIQEHVTMLDSENVHPTHCSILSSIRGRLSGIEIKRKKKTLLSKSICDRKQWWKLIICKDHRG